jgi:glycosyltransferase involved in cell wall biosynthesis
MSTHASPAKFEIRDMTVDSCPISVVIPTHNRRRDCERAVRSALEQAPRPLEVIVCDDGSSDDTQTALEELQAREPLVRYFRLSPAHGTPGPARNRGIAEARGAWVALLDDDDRWMPGKLAAQLPFVLEGTYDVVTTDALTANDERYFGPMGGPQHPDRRELEDHNPLIISSSVVRRSMLLEVGGFDETRWMRSVADYDLWLRLADHGARFVVVDDPLIAYDDASGERLSTAMLQTRLAELTLHWRRWRRAPTDREVARAMLRAAATTPQLALRALRLRLQTR